MRVKASFIEYPAKEASQDEISQYLRDSAELFRSQAALVEAAATKSPHDLVAGLRLMDARVDSRVLGLPRRRSRHSDPAHDPADLVIPGHTLPVSRYEKDVVHLRAAVLDHRQRDIKDATKRRLTKSWTSRLIDQGPWNWNDDPVSYDGPPALPMPVELSDAQSLRPFFQHLSGNGDDFGNLPDAQEGHEPYYNIHLLEYEKGVLYSDGRLDLCKKVVGPHNIGALMHSLRTNTFTKHFLLGNNIIGPAGAQAINQFVHDYPNRFETWYLAGNCIDSTSLGMLVDAWVWSSAVTNIWLKRNPLGPAAAPHLFRLVTQTKNLRTLDLDQTELSDAGAAHFFSLLAEYLQRNPPIALQHLYLNANGLGPLTMAALSKFLSQQNCQLQSLYMSMNPIGLSLPLLCPGIAQCSSLHRLVLSSCGLTTASVRPLLTAAAAHPSLRVLVLSQSYATADLSARFNWLDDDLVPSLVDFINASPALIYTSLGHVPMTAGGPAFSQLSTETDPASSVGGITALHRAVAAHPSLQTFDAKSIYPNNMFRTKTYRDHRWLFHATRKEAKANLIANVEKANGMSFEEWFEGERRFLLSPRDVRFIDSVYRNRDAGKARRGEMVLQKKWKEGDGVLDEVKRIDMGS
ncbi:hypothetical protein KVT40_004246 [Elsinoe batatas]|uniref:RNI-like protein n=1 Tax=Elsinoe batatas TaxID=2601811 RepID=A0A8K0L9W6_9PEZI|nr:hypothetical protein KVT40_004246 [Elsinoe batatas]